MAKHLTTRLAWHDNKWNGKICNKPDEDAYCTAPRSLLSKRITRRRNLEFEKKNGGEKIDEFLPEYIPPCFWSANAFAPDSAQIVFNHPFINIDKKIDDYLPGYSIFTWPFRLSFNHSKEKKDKEGTYPPDLEDRINHFFDKFKPGETIVFFYMHVDNPISADEHKYALVGCSKLSEIGNPTQYSFDDQELEKWRKKEGMKNFPTVNWARRVTHDFENTGVKLPYHKYLEYTEKNPQERKKLEEIKVLVDENELVPRFKYVAEEMNDDQCLYLLYKLRKAIMKVQKHSIVESFDREEKLVEKYIQEVWERRGLYPGLGNVLSLLANPDSEDVDKENKIVKRIKENLPENQDLLNYTFELLEEGENVPDYLQKFERTVQKIRNGITRHEPFLGFLKKMSLFSLTKFQLLRILYPESQTPKIHPFGGKEIKPQKIESNPYLLCEEYTPITKREKRENKERDRLDIRERPISLFTIDIGMFPDEEYTAYNNELQDLGPVSPQRLRAVIIENLKQIGTQGDCYASLDAICERVREHPLFYKQVENEDLRIRKDQLKTDRCRKHFQERLRLVDRDGEVFFYLEEVKEAEEVIEDVVKKLVNKKDHKINTSWISNHVEKEKQNLEKREPIEFDATRFEKERKNAYQRALTKPFSLITGKPGTGKTYVLREIVKRIEDLGENLIVLAPTGKATLRLKEETGFEEAQTIDRFLYRNEFSDCLKNFENILEMEEKGKRTEIENLIIDEASMVDLQRLGILFKLLDYQGVRNIKRVILVGDNYQLPPIGFGCPFHDIVENFKRDEKRRKNHLVNLIVNCRHEFDPKILKASEVFRGKNRYYYDIFEELKTDGEISKWLNVDYWEDREELKNYMRERLDELLERETDIAKGNREEKINTVFNLHKEGFVKNNDAETLNLDGFQIITPYRAGYYGTLGLNEYIRDEFKNHAWQPREGRSPFFHSDKLIRTTNWYQWNPRDDGTQLALANGSIGVVCDHNFGKENRRGYFPDYSPDYPFFTWNRLDNEENFDLAYAITIHKAQGSDFDNTSVVIPMRRGLLTKELIYTALTRSRGPLNLFVQEPKEGEDNPLEIARSRSSLRRRNTSLFSGPMKSFFVLYPDSDDWVKSRIEYIIYRALRKEEKEGSIQFSYEEELVLDADGKDVKIHPDFTVETDNRVYYWEHLGLLDQRDYYEDWKRRRSLYRKNDLESNLITTDDLNGIMDERIKRVIGDMLQDDLIMTKDSRFSNHHYRLYEG